jgi:hypothetical protein
MWLAVGKGFLDAKAQRFAKDAKGIQVAFLAVFAFLCAFASKNRSRTALKPPAA